MLNEDSIVVRKCNRLKIKSNSALKGIQFRELLKTS